MSEAAPEPHTLGKYRLLQPLARGGMAELYLARQQAVAGIEKTVVIKRALPHLAKYKDFVGMFLDEARIAAQLDHPNIVQLFDFGEADGDYYIAMEYLAGEDLTTLARAAKKRERRIPESLAAYVFASACDGLHYAHTFVDETGRALNIVHRDISPSNIFVTYQGAVKLLDFGIAKAEGKLTRTRTGLLKGKYLYMSPEQVRGDPLDGRSDVFALGAVLYEVLTGEPAFLRDTELDTLRAIVFEPVEPPRAKDPSMSAAMEAIVLKSLATNLEERFSSALQMREALEEVLVERATGAVGAQLQAYVRELMGDDRVARRLRPPTFAGPRVATPSTGDEESARLQLEGGPVERATPSSGNALLDAPTSLRGSWAAGHLESGVALGREAAPGGQGASGAQDTAARTTGNLRAAGLVGESVRTTELESQASEAVAPPAPPASVPMPATPNSLDRAENEQSARAEAGPAAHAGATGSAPSRGRRVAALAVVGALGGVALLFGSKGLYRAMDARPRDSEALDLIRVAHSTADASASERPVGDRLTGEGKRRLEPTAAAAEVAPAPRTATPPGVAPPPAATSAPFIASAPGVVSAPVVAPEPAIAPPSGAAASAGSGSLPNAVAKPPRSLAKSTDAPVNREGIASPWTFPPEDGPTGQLIVICQKPCRILIDGHDLHLIAPRMLKVPAGRHRVRAVNVATEEAQERSVEIPVGGRESVSF